MTDDARRTLKRCIEQACTALHAPFGRFAADVGLNDFFLDTFDVPRTPKEVAVRALEELCEGDKRKNDGVVCLAVIAFLDALLGRPSQDPDRYVRLRDLAGLVGASGASADFERWVETWYE